MTEAEREQLFRRMAGVYADREGEALLAENKNLQKSGVQYLTPRADRAAKQLARGGRRISRGAWSAIAAGIVIMLLVPSVLILSGRWPGLGKTAKTPEAVMDAAVPAASSEAAAAPMEEPAAEAAPEPAANAEADGGAAGGTDGLLMPLPFDLPENFTVAAAKMDNGQSIYYLADAFNDDVVLTMKPVGEGQDDMDTEDLRVFDVNGKTVYGRSNGAYSFLTFEEDGVQYTLTCKYDINTLLELSRVIITEEAGID